MIPFRKTLGFRLLCITFILLVIPLLVDSFIFLEGRYQRQIIQGKSLLANQLQIRSLPFKGLEEDVDKMFSMLLYFFKFGEQMKASAALNEELQNLAKINGYFGIIVAKLTEDHRYISIGSNLPDYRDVDVTEQLGYPDPYSFAARRLGYVLSFVQKPYPLLLQTRGIYNSEGVPIGLISLLFDRKDKMTELLKSGSAPFVTNYALVLPSSLILYASDHSLEGHSLRPLTSFEKKQFTAQQEVVPKEPLLLERKHDSSYFTFTWEKNKQIGLVQPLEGTDYQLMIYASVADVLGSPTYKLIWNYASYVLIFIVGFILALAGTKRLSKPLKSLSSVMQSIERGDINSRYQKDPLGFEINHLGAIFNNMVDTLIEKEKSAENERIIKETFAKELMLGQKVQRSLLPEAMPLLKGAQISHAFAPAIEVGGDFYDAYLKENGTLILSVADASGKGVRACCYSLTLKNMIRTLVQKSDDVASVSQLANNLFCTDTGDSGMFVTAIIAQYFPSTKELTYYSSGHNPLLFFRKKERKVYLLEFLDIAMGVMEKKEIKKAGVLTLERGDIVLLYSDGVTEAHNKQGEMYSEERLQQFIAQKADLSANDLVAELMEELKSFAKDTKQHDDITILLMKIL